MTKEQKLTIIIWQKGWLELLHWSFGDMWSS